MELVAALVGLALALLEKHEIKTAVIRLNSASIPPYLISRKLQCSTVLPSNTKALT